MPETTPATGPPPTDNNWRTTPTGQGAWQRFWHSDAGLNWRAAVVLGLISSTFSTIISQFLAARIGRDAIVDWMVVASIPVGDAALQITPTGPIILAGILFHQWADFSWEVFFFGLLGRWTARLQPWTLMLAAGPWALFTSAMEWLVLVPLFPFWQPIFPLEQPYWVGFLVHLASASTYPLFPGIRDWFGGQHHPHRRRFALVWGALAIAGALLCAVVTFLGAHEHELPWTGQDAARDQAYIRRMFTHHAQGIAVAKIAAERASDPHLRALARLMAAEQAGDSAIFDQWWRSWFPNPLQLCSPDEQAAMPGMLRPDQVEQLRQVPDADFDPLFVQLMRFHHAGAVEMADEEIHSLGDIRLRIMAQAIRHAQQGEIEMMRGTSRLPAVRAAVLDLFSARITTADTPVPP
ncbi:MAG: DUF305 domain-containing protein [Rhodopila sp.]